MIESVSKQKELLCAPEPGWRATNFIDSKKSQADYEQVGLARTGLLSALLRRSGLSNKKRFRVLDASQTNSQLTLDASPSEDKPDPVDRLAGLIESVKPYSMQAVLIALASLGLATMLRFAAGWAATDLRFSIYLPAILATGLLAGIPAALGVAAAAVVIVVWAFVPPFFAFKSYTSTEQLNIFFNVIPYLITIYFAYLCRVVLLRLRRREIANRLLTKELEHRVNNTYTVIEAVVRKTLAHDAKHAKSILGRLRAMRYANELLVGNEVQSITIRNLLEREFAPYGPQRLQAKGPNVEIPPEKARHLIFLFHELATNAAKHGSLSCPTGRVFVDWRRDANGISLTWKELGGPVVRPPSKKGFGSRLIESCGATLSGTLRKNFEPSGLACSVHFRLDS